MWTRGESNPRLIHAMDVCYRYTTGPSLEKDNLSPRKELNPHLFLRTELLYPLSYGEYLRLYPYITISDNFFNVIFPFQLL